MKPGTRVYTHNGIYIRGIVISAIPKNKYTDGSYREPYSWEYPIYVKWDDGTMGWISKKFIAKEGEGLSALALCSSR